MLIAKRYVNPFYSSWMAYLPAVLADLAWHADHTADLLDQCRRLGKGVTGIEDHTANLAASGCQQTDKNLWRNRPRLTGIVFQHNGTIGESVTAEVQDVGLVSQQKPWQIGDTHRIMFLQPEAIAELGITQGDFNRAAFRIQTQSGGIGRVGC